MDKSARPYNALSLVAENGGWNSPIPRGRAIGVAVTSCFYSITAHLEEVSVGKNGSLTVHKMVCGLNCGTAIYPDAIRV